MTIILLPTAKEILSENISFCLFSENISLCLFSGNIISFCLFSGNISLCSFSENISFCFIISIWYERLWYDCYAFQAQYVHSIV